MKALHIISAAFTAILMSAGLRSKAQTLSPAPGDTLNLVIFNNDTNFDAKRTRIFSDKNTVDSLATILAADSSKHYRIVYRKQGVKGRVVSHKDFRKLDRSGIFSIMVAYNKKGLPEDDAPIYIVTSK
ncbi:hypothetical protein [Mucilaginibacter myungsuensis]|uniref:Uncharacterized protein n=1 Tax=Mucilaginibacter myungsuensis TaxID=649104 RepID=A0A929L3B6_9SPHI|nr:hypothetical protein [Mucilaginibacter myungsuensis]MBE9663285.1 hypothetical protein [Mucilaginibacter myungsuensis]MDN3600020.1 hypothetical protein [Mucilaginibacter myungsuensis]